jgi:hypothetical protein
MAKRMGSAVGITRWIITVLAKWGRFFACASLVLLAGCGGSNSDSGPQPITSVKVTSGDNQTGSVDTQLSQPLVAQLLDASGAPIEGATVTFAVSEGGGSLFVSVATSDASGYVRDNWTLGSMVTLQQVQVRGVSSNGTPTVYATFTAKAVAGTPTELTVASGDAQSAQQLQPLPSPVTVLITDTHGNPAAGVTVTFAPQSGGMVSPATATTNVAGEASTTWTLGQALGVQILNVSVQGIAAISASATSTEAPHGPPVQIAIHSGNFQTALQHTMVANNLTVKVTDALGNGVPLIGVTFSAAAGSGYVTPITSTTDSSGGASWTGYVHVAGTQLISATYPGGGTVTFTVNVTPNGMLYDGSYGINYLDPESSPHEAESLTITITNGVMLVPADLSQAGLPIGPAGSGSIDETTGAVSINYPLGFTTDDSLQFTGQFMLDASARATGNGTVVYVPPPSTPPPSGVMPETWTANRQ